MVLVFCFSPDIDHHRVPFEYKHCHANIPKNLPQIKQFELTFHDFVIAHFRRKIPKNADHANAGHSDAKHGKVRQKRVRFNPTYGQGWDGQQGYVKFGGVTVAAIVCTSRIFAHYIVDLLSDKVKIAATSAELHDPYGNVDANLADLSKESLAQLTIRMHPRMSLRHQQTLHHCVYVQQADD